MSTYYDYRDVKVMIAHKLMKMDGWKVYGYSPDNSDPMTDYWDPANWGGVAEKNGYVRDEEPREYFGHSLWMATDDYGRRLYYVEGDYYYYPNDNKQINYIQYYWQMVAILNPDGSFNSETFMVELEDKANYQDQIRDLKIANNWNKPFD